LKLKGIIPKQLSPECCFSDEALQQMAAQMIGKPVTCEGKIVGQIIASAVVDNDHIEYEYAPSDIMYR